MRELVESGSGLNSRTAWDGAKEFLMYVQQMIALELERAVVATKNATQNALISSVGRMSKITHRIL